MLQSATIWQLYPVEKLADASQKLYLDIPLKQLYAFVKYIYIIFIHEVCWYNSPKLHNMKLVHDKYILGTRYNYPDYNL